MKNKVDYKIRELKVNKQEISNKLNQYFSSIGEKLSQDIETSTMSPVQAIKRTHTCFKLKQITPKQVYNLLVSLPNGKPTVLT